MTKLDSEVLFIAEISANHLGSLERAKELVRQASNAGAGAVKFQTYTPKTMTLDIDKFSVNKNHQLWGGRRLYQLYEEAQTPWEWHKELFELCRSLKVIPFSSPFDLTAVDFLESIDAPMYKIASLETGDHQLIKAVANTGKPIIISTGATQWSEIEELVSVVEETGNKDLTLLLCTSSYPSDPVDAHLRRMTSLKNAFNVRIGLSDHTLGIGVSLAAIALGASAIEKHLTLQRSDGGADSAFSMEPNEFKLLVNEGKSAFEALGSPEWKMLDSEKESRNLRRSLYVVEKVLAGDLVTNQNVRAIRPTGGCPPKLLSQMLGMRFKNDAEIGTPMQMELLDSRVSS
jgi:pseudaminic acid synthase